MTEAIDQTADQSNEQAAGQGEDTEFPFFASMGGAIKDLGEKAVEAVKGQFNDVKHDVTDPIQRVKTLIEVLNKLVEEHEAQGAEDGAAEGEEPAESGEDTPAEGEESSDEGAAEDAPAEDTPAEEAPSEDAAAEETPAAEEPADEAGQEEAPAESPAESGEAAEGSESAAEGEAAAQ